MALSIESVDPILVTEGDALGVLVHLVPVGFVPPVTGRLACLLNRPDTFISVLLKSALLVMSCHEC